MPQRILGLDIGAWSVKSVVLEDKFRGFRVVRASEVRVPDGEPDTLRQRQVEAIGALMAMDPEKVDATITSLAGGRTVVRNISLPYADTKKIDQTIAGELADVIPFDLDEANFDHVLVEKTADGGSVSMAVAARHQDIGDRIELFSDADIDPKHLLIDTLQLYNLYTHFVRDDASKAEEPTTPAGDASTFVAASAAAAPDARLIVDIGHERTLLCAASENGIAYVRSVPAGGQDVTSAIAAAANVDNQQAEALKHEEGFVASARHPAPDERAQQVSDLVAAGLAGLVRELRRSLQAIRSERRVRVARIDLLGGGSRIRNLANYLADQLNVPVAQGVAVEQIVEREVEAARRPAFSGALASALRVVGDESVSTIDMRMGEFAFAGQLAHLRTRIPAIAAIAAVMLVLLGVNVYASYSTMIAREATIDKQFCDITKKVIGRKICEPKRAISAMQSPASELGNVRFPVRSALNIAAELSSRIPEKLDVHIREMQIHPSRAKISGETTTFDAVDQIVGEYAKDPCYKDIKKGKLRRKAGGDRIEFALSMQLECS